MAVQPENINPVFDVAEAVMLVPAEAVAGTPVAVPLVALMVMVYEGAGSNSASIEMFSSGIMKVSELDVPSVMDPCEMFHCLN